MKRGRKIKWKSRSHEGISIFAYIYLWVGADIPLFGLDSNHYVGVYPNYHCSDCSYTGLVPVQLLPESESLLQLFFTLIIYPRKGVVNSKPESLPHYINSAE